MKCRREYDLKVIGQNLKRSREAKNLSVEEVKRYLHLGSVQAVYKYESGKGYPQADTLLALMELYEVEWHDLVDNHDDVKKRISQKKEVILGYSDYVLRINETKVIMIVNKNENRLLCSTFFRKGSMIMDYFMKG